MRKAMAAALTGMALVGLAGTASAQSTSTDYPWPPKDVTPVHKTKAELQKQADEFTAHQRQSYPEIFSGARFVTPGLWGGERAGAIEDGQQYLANEVKYYYDGAKRSVITQVNAPGFYTDSPEQLCQRERCTSTVSDDKGGVVVFYQLDEYGISVAKNFRPNGEVVWTQGSPEDDPALLGAVASDRAYTFTR
jgi:hypothetical protein